MKADYVHKDSRTLEEKPQVFTRWIDPTIEELKRENQELKSQLEEKDTLIKQCELSVSNVMDCYCERTDCSGRIKDSKQYDSLVQKVENQQKEFIEYLENYIKEMSIQNINSHPSRQIILETIIDTLKANLSKYKQIIGKDINVGTKGGKE